MMYVHSCLCLKKTIYPVEITHFTMELKDLCMWYLQCHNHMEAYRKAVFKHCVLTDALIYMDESRYANTGTDDCSYEVS